MRRVSPSPRRRPQSGSKLPHSTAAAPLQYYRGAQPKGDGGAAAGEAADEGVVEARRGGVAGDEAEGCGRFGRLQVAERRDGLLVQRETGGGDGQGAGGAELADRALDRRQAGVGGARRQRAGEQRQLAAVEPARGVGAAADEVDAAASRAARRSGASAASARAGQS